MRFIFTFLLYFLIGVTTGTIFSTEIKFMMDHAVVPAVKDVYGLVKSEIMPNSQEPQKPAQKVSSTVEIQKPLPLVNQNQPVGVDRLGYEVYQDEQGYYVIDETGATIGIQEDEIERLY